MLYDFEHRKTGKVKEYDLKISEYDDFVKAHPELLRVHLSSLNIGDPVKLGVIRPPKDFQVGVIDRMRQSIPGAKTSGALDRRWPKSVTEI